MMRSFAIFFIICFWSFVNGSNDEYSSDCLYAILEKTQSCENTNILYVTTMGQSSGLGSEFNSYLVPSLLEAMFENRRMVYLKSKRPWEYDCPSKSGWACYLNFLCALNGVDYKDIDLSNQGDVHNPFLFPGSSFLSNHPSTELHNKIPKLQQMFDAFKKEKISLSASQCDINKITRTVLLSIAAKYLYKLNVDTKMAVRKINSRYAELHRSGYYSLQFRMTDKFYEMDYETWVWMSDMSKTADLLRPFFAASTIKKLYTGLIY